MKACQETAGLRPPQKAAEDRVHNRMEGALENEKRCATSSSRRIGSSSWTSRCILGIEREGRAHLAGGSTQLSRVTTCHLTPIGVNDRHEGAGSDAPQDAAAELSATVNVWRRASRDRSDRGDEQLYLRLSEVR